METTCEPGGMDRRRSQREPAGWMGTYMVIGRPELGWGECRVLDVSTAGVGLELYGPWPRDDADKALLIKLDPSGPSGDCDDDSVESRCAQLPGVVRNLGASRFGFLRVGVEFVGLGPDQRQLLMSLLGRERV